MTRRTLVVLIAAITALVGVAACSGDYNRYVTDAAPSTTTEPTTTPTTEPPPTSSSTVPPSTAPPTTVPGEPTTTVAPPPGVPPGRLAVVSADGDLLTVRPDGAEVRTVADAPAGGTVVQASWSPDSSRLAFSTTTRSDAAVGVATTDGAPPTTWPLPTAPYHVAWSPTQAQLAYLRVDSVNSVELAVADAPVADDPDRLASGAPVYGSWSPDGGRLLATIDDEQLVVVDQSGTTTTLSTTVAPSGAPAWLDDTTVVFALQTASDRRLVRFDVDTRSRQDMLTYEGVITFVPDPTGERLAYQLTPEEGPSGGGGRISFPHAHPRAQTQSQPPSALDGVLAVHDLASGADTQVHDETVAAFQWNPDGTRLALLDTDDDGAGRWRFWAADDAAATLSDAPEFVPAATSTQLVFPYFDQLAASTRWWAPDGSAFAFAGRMQGRDGVWVVPSSGGEATFAHEGELVTWSWQ